MKKLFSIIVAFLLFNSILLSQGVVRGKISEKSGETLIGVTVTLKEKPGVGSITDLDGNYSLKITDSTEQTIVVSYVSYQTIEEKVHLKKGEVIVKDFNMETASKALTVVEVVAKSSKAKEYYMENIKKNSSTSIDYISSETMKKTGDANVVAAVARVTGVSTNGGFITVRGIGDRYVKTTINGNRIPTLDPFTNNIKLDMFPASLVDNIIITKTASPDLPGDWAGAYISVETKDYPEQLTLNIESTVGYNNQSTFKDVISSQRSSSDWMGYDNGFREHDHAQFQSAVSSPGEYQEFVALGLGSYFKSLGITGWNNGDNNDLYFKLGLVKLGLLAPALINDHTAFVAAKTSYYHGNYQSQAYATINAGAAKSGQSFPDNWNTTQRKAPLNFSQSFSVGDQLQLFGKPLGFIAGFRYANSTVSDPNSNAERPKPDLEKVESQKGQYSSKETNGWSALVNLAYKLNTNNSISFLFMPNVYGLNSVTSGYDNIKNTLTKAQFYESRKQMVYQLKSEHYLPKPKLKIELNASYTKGNSNAPDFKYLTYEANTQTNSYGLDPGVNPINRYYRYLSDNLFDSHISAEIPLGNKPGLPRKLKFGGAYQFDKIKNDQYNYFLGKDGLHTPVLQNDDIDSYLSLNQFGVSSGNDLTTGTPYSTLLWYYNRDNVPTDHSFGRSSIKAAFLMADYSIIPRIRITGGLRVEYTNVLTDVVKFDSLGLSANDPRRYYKEGYAPAAPGTLNEISYLPSANLIYKLVSGDENPINIRIGYSQSVARPSIRELSDITTFDYELQTNVTGNPNLKIAHVKNYDFRIESYFKNKDNLSLSVFYKDFKDHIELERADNFYWQNVDKSNVTGIELEGRKAIIKGLDLRANVTLVKSYTSFVRTTTNYVGGATLVSYEDTVKRPMFGQAPYIVNAILSYTSDSLKFTATLSYNIQGPRLVIGSNNKSTPDIYELQRNLLDFKLTKNIGKHFSASFTIKDILNEYITRAYKYDDGYNIFYDRYRWGTTYQLSILYKL